MLGITVTDAIAVGTFLLGLAAFWKGSRAGDAAKRLSPPLDTVSIGATVFADTMAMNQLTGQLTRIGDILETAVDARERAEKDRLALAVEALIAKLGK